MTTPTTPPPITPPATGPATPDHSASLLLLVGCGFAVLGYTMPVISFRGAGNALHDLAMFEKLPVMSGLAALALVAALASRFLPALARWGRPATVVAIVAVLVPAIWGFISAIDAWSGLRAMIAQTAGTRTVFINPAAGYVPLLAAAAMLALSLRGMPAASAVPRGAVPAAA